MARAVLVVGAVAFAAGGCCALAAVGVDRLLVLLPPLAVDADAVGGAALGVSLVAIAAGASRRPRCPARGGAWRPAGLPAVRRPGGRHVGLAGSVRQRGLAGHPPCRSSPRGAASLAAAVGYALAAVRLARELGSGAAS